MDTAIVLGGTSPHVELIKKLKNRKYNVVLVDYLDNSPGVKFADEHVKESTLDLKKVLKIARDKKAKLVISTCIDQANSTCCYVAEELNLPHPYSYQTSLDVTDKGRMKKIMVDNKIPTSSFQVVTCLDEINWEKILYPVVVKPVDCNSSKGVRKASNHDEVLEYVEDALEFSRTKRAIIEEFNEGFEIQVDCIATDNSADVIMTRQKKQIKSKKDIVLQSTGSVIPANLSDEFNEQVCDIASKIAVSFGLKNTPFFYQAIVTKNGISVIEFAPRIGGGLSYYLLKNIAGVDVVECAIDSFLGNKIQYKKNVIDNIYSTNLLYVKPCTFDHVEGFESLKNCSNLVESFVMKQKGTVIDSDMRSGNRVAAYISKADSYENLTKVENSILDKIKILNDKNEDVLIRDLK